MAYPDAPTSDDIIAWSKLAFDDLGIEQDPDLVRIVQRAIAHVSQVTGRYFDDTLPRTPVDLYPLMQQATQYRTEQLCVQEQDEYAESAADDITQSLSVGGYSETRRQIGEQFRRGATGRPVINPDPRLNDLYWMLMTEDQREYWVMVLLGVQAPAFEVSGIDGSGATGIGFYDPVVGWEYGWHDR